jgi:pimeloyl-ACP methyl ester carboxylesterase
MSLATAPFRIEHQHARLGEVSLHYATAGEGDPVVLVHGWPSTWYEWRHVMPLISGRYKVIAPDLRGSATARAPRPATTRRRSPPTSGSALGNAGPGPLASGRP